MRRFDNHVEITSQSGVVNYDFAIIATHADTALKILVDATTEEAKALAEMPYSTNQTWLHTDSKVLPTLSGALS